MSNIRNFKKNIYTICGDIAADALLAAYIFPKEVKKEAIDNIINELAALQEDTVALAAISFDRNEKSFENRAEYRKARHQYFKTAFNKLEKEFLDRAMEIVKQLNDAVPHDVRKVIG